VNNPSLFVGNKVNILTVHETTDPRQRTPCSQ